MIHQANKTVNLTIIYTYFGQKERIPGILKEKHSDTRVVIVDDCHSDQLGRIEGLDVYRVETDIKWNQPGAKNLGFQESEGWIVCADIDHLVTRDNVEQILRTKKEKGTIYYLGREDTNSLNVFLIHKDDFKRIGGYDEDFSGNYGYDDIEFLYRCQKNLKVAERRDIKVKVYAEEISSKLDRDLEANTKVLEQKKDKKTNTGKRLRFNWKKL
jgi:hypothetical protein